MAKTLVTHINPHLDDIAAIWLFEKFHPDFKEAKVEFISQSIGNKPLDESKNLVYFGVGRGKYDEHKGDLKDCATSLVWKEIKQRGFAPKDEVQLKALGRLVEWVRLIDLGLSKEENSAFSVPAFLRPLDSTQEGSKKAVDLGAEILDRVLEVLIREETSKKDWENRIEFETKFGKSFAIKSRTINRGFCNNQGGDLFLMYDLKYSGVQFYTPSQEIDLELIYKKIKELKPEENWFLHQSHHMVICGSGSAPDAKPTDLSFENLIEIAKSV